MTFHISRKPLLLSRVESMTEYPDIQWPHRAQMRHVDGDPIVRDDGDARLESLVLSLKVQDVKSGIDHHAPTPKPTEYEQAPKTSSWNPWWTWEIIATVASLVAQAAVVAILASMQDKPLGRWHWFININTSVSVLTTAAKSTMLFSVTACLGQLKWIYFRGERRQLRHFGLFDEAVKGPLGATQVLWSIRWITACIGAAVVVLALGFDPFAQQVIRFEQTNVTTSVEGDATFSFTQNYTYGTPQSIFTWDTDIANGKLLVGL